MEIKKEINDLYHFEAWSGATETREKIIEAGRGEQFMTALEEVYPEGMTDTELNDLLWFDSKFCYDLVGLDENGDEPQDDDDDDDEEETEE